MEVHAFHLCSMLSRAVAQNVIGQWCLKAGLCKRERIRMVRQLSLYITHCVRDCRGGSDCYLNPCEPPLPRSVSVCASAAESRYVQHSPQRHLQRDFQQPTEPLPRCPWTRDRTQAHEPRPTQHRRHSQPYLGFLTGSKRKGQRSHWRCFIHVITAFPQYFIFSTSRVWKIVVIFLFIPNAPNQPHI